MILLDTHAFLWAIAGDKRLGPVARHAIASAEIRYASSISHVELAIKSAKGKVRLPLDYDQLLEALGIEELPFTNRHALKVRELVSREHGDPFDWMLLAQARAENLTLVTADRVLQTFDGTIDATK